MITTTLTLHTLAAALETAAHAEYAADPDRFTATPHAWLFTDARTDTLRTAEAALAAAIGPDRRTRFELACRNMSAPDVRTGAYLAERLRTAATLAAVHAAKHNVTPNMADPDHPAMTGMRCPCGRWICDPVGILQRARRDVYGRGITPGHAVARIVLAYSFRTGRTRAAVQGFFPGSCGAPMHGDWLDGGMPDRVGRITPAEVAAYLHRHGQRWRIVAGTDATDALTAAGYRVCGHPRHDHPVTAAMLADPGPWVPTGAADWHVEHGAVSAIVVDGAR